jgi:hypothetical protein
MPSRWEVMLAGPQDAPVPLAAPQAVVSGWLDDPRPRGPGLAPVAGARSAHADPARAWACGPLQTSPHGQLGETGDMTILHVRLLDDALTGRLVSAVRPGRPVRLGACEYQVAAPAVRSAGPHGRTGGAGQGSVPGRSVSLLRCACAAATVPPPGRPRIRLRAA